MRRAFLLLVIGLVALAGAGRAGAAGFTSQEVTITADDGVVIAAGLYEPTGAPPAGGWPAVATFHGIGGKHEDIAAVSEAFAAAGYVVLSPDARGHGKSGGFFTLDGPRELQDIRQQFDWLAARSGVDARKIGCWGISLGGGAAMNSALAGVPWAAIETVETWSDLYHALFPQDLGKTGAIFQFGQGVSSTIPPSLQSLLQDMLANRNLPAIRAFFDDRSSLQRDSSLTTPTFIFQSRKDFAFDIEEGASAYRRLGGPKRLYIGDFGHAPSTFPGPDIEHVLDLGTRWFDRFLKGMPNGIDTALPVEVAAAPWTGKTASFAGLPPTRSVAFTLRGKSKLAATGKVVRSVRLKSTVEQFGAPVVKATLSSPGSFAHVVAVLTVKGAGGEDVVTEGGRLLPGLGPKAKTFSFRLISVAHLLRKGATLRLTLAGASTAQNGANLLYLNQPAATARLSIGTVRLTLPVLKKTISR